MNVRMTKLHGAGNDILVLLKEALPGEITPSEFVQEACNRTRGIGADGLVLLTFASDACVYVESYNCKGSSANMCFNGLRCVACYLEKNGISAPPYNLQTNYGVVTAAPNKNSTKLFFEPPSCTVTPIPLHQYPFLQVRYFAPIADPHLVVTVDRSDFENIDFPKMAASLRRSTDLYPNGTNVHLISENNSTWRIKSFERGIENETEACGSACVASTHVLKKSHVSYVTTSGDTITVSTNDDHWCLEGPVSYIGQIEYAL